MKQIKIIIEKSKDYYSAYAENVEGVYGAVNTIAEAKQSILDAIKLTKKYSGNKMCGELKGNPLSSLNLTLKVH